MISMEKECMVKQNDRLSGTVYGKNVRFGRDFLRGMPVSIGFRKLFARSAFAAMVLVLAILTLSADEYTSVYEYSFETMQSARPPQRLQIILKSVGPNDKRQLVRGVLFTYESRSAAHVYIGGTFSDWRRVVMRRNGNGIWYYFLSEYEKEDRVLYKFNVDGIWITDPLNDELEDDQYGSYLSVAWPDSTPDGRFVTYRMKGGKKISTVEFRLYDETADYVSIAGDFNNWNPENDILTRGEDNIWRVTKKLPRGKYRYKYIVNGEWKVDLYNPDTAADDTGGAASLIIVK